MEDFLRANYLLLTHSVEILAAVTGLLLYKKYKFTAAKYFICFLVFIVFAEVIALYTHLIQNGGFFSFLKGTVFQTNTWWSTLYWKIGSIMFYSFYFMKIIKTKKFLLILKYSRYLFFVFLFFI